MKNLLNLILAWTDNLPNPWLHFDFEEAAISKIAFSASRQRHRTIPGELGIMFGWFSFPDTRSETGQGGT